MKKKMMKWLALCLIMVLTVMAVGCTKTDKPTEPNATEDHGSDQSASQETKTPTSDIPTTESSDETPATDHTGEVDPSESEAPTGPEENPYEGMELPEEMLPGGIVYDVDHQYLYGVGYVDDQMNNRVTVDQAVYLIKSLGSRSVRVWSNCVENSHKLKDWYVPRLHELAKKLKDAGIQVIFTFYQWESPEGTWTYIPRRNLTEGSNYMIALKNWEDMISMVVKEFPEIDYWELGNEWNHTGAINPTDYKADGSGGPAFTYEEKADITTDLILRTMRAARKAGSNATMLLPAMAPSDGMDGIAMTSYLDRIYKNIESGDWGSTNPRDFFDALAWHPYLQSMPDVEWVSNNNRVYQVAIEHGDAGIPVYLTELGFPDGGNPKADAEQANYLVAAYDLIQKYMPYVESLHYYRMFTDSSRVSDTYGLINQPEDGFGPKAKGLAYQKMTGGKGDLYKFYLPLDED